MKAAHQAMNKQQSQTCDTRPDAGTVTSSELLGERRQLGILHNGEHYTLRITANNKLILTK